MLHVGQGRVLFWTLLRFESPSALESWDQVNGEEMVPKTAVKSQEYTKDNAQKQD